MDVPVENPGKSGKNADSGSGGGGWVGGRFHCNFIQRLAQKLCRIILLHLGLVTVPFHFGKT